MNLPVALSAVISWDAMAEMARNQVVMPVLQIKIGAKLALYQPEILLLLFASGLMISFWSRRDAAIGFAVFFLGVLIGLPVMYYLQIDLLWLALILMLVFGGIVAVQVFPPVRIQQAYLVLAGMCCAPLALLGHAFSQTPLLMLGNFAFTQFLVLSAAYLICVSLQRLSRSHWWLTVVLRVFGSWAAAAAIMLGAFYANA